MKTEKLIPEILSESPNRRSLLKSLGVATSAASVVLAATGKLQAQSATPTVVSISAYLSQIAQRAGIEFFCAHPQGSFFPVVRPQEGAIWPASVERAMLSWLKSRAR